MPLIPENENDTVSERTSRHRIARRRATWGGLGAATVALVLLASGAALGGDNDTSTPATTASVSSATPGGGGSATVELPESGPPGFGDPSSRGNGHSDIRNPFDWAARVACRVAENIDVDPERKTVAQDCDNLPTHGSDPVAEPFCDHAMADGFVDGESDLEEVFAAAFMFALLADGSTK